MCRAEDLLGAQQEREAGQRAGQRDGAREHDAVELAIALSRPARRQQEAKYARAEARQEPHSHTQHANLPAQMGE